ncbi:hypothetical protein PHYSODRAFT_299574 [Phytophthora sojae]|uniref:Uncharacterized protein n=1 Tax=Phytophthora sojae (strain P6497) TaxID=1094619 RepID=G4ZCC0_PHYSP|nr:hypothetical protein PHYSODRAFT_299574 [Phytophthora sojae]EGZ22148.1 hypothetical protein PHYSODRAFT_299574 [Phytophthora sojae]|eukprot:XP_009524865.1 hypothetical protein PHYSODRAFT_299574 [Phytophthora sojae]
MTLFSQRLCARLGTMMFLLPNSLVAGYLVVGTPTGFAAGTTGGGDAKPVYHYRPTVIIHRKLFKAFNLVRDDAIQCPVCHAKAKPVTCGFYNCAWKVEGVRAADGFSVISTWRDAGEERYHRCDVGGSLGCIEWKSLLVVVKSRFASDAAKLVSERAVASKDNHWSMSVFVFWRDEHERGLKGVLEVHSSDLPQQDARVSGLIWILDYDILPVAARDGVSRQVVTPAPASRSPDG